MRMTEYEYTVRIQELLERIEELEEENAQLLRDYLSLERYCERLEQGDV